MSLFQSVKSVFKNKAIHMMKRGSVHADIYFHVMLKIPSLTMFTCMDVVSSAHNINVTKNTSRLKKNEAEAPDHQLSLLTSKHSISQEITWVFYSVCNSFLNIYIFRVKSIKFQNLLIYQSV